MPVTREAVVERARALAPLVAEREGKCEDLRRVPEETIQAFKDEGLLRVLVPKEFGGYALPLPTVIETAREIGAACGSSAWCLAICSLHNWMVSGLPEAAQREVFGPSPDAIVCGVFMPGGTATPVDSGFRLSGHWDFASTCDHAGHALLSGLIRPDAETPPQGLGSFLVRRSDFAIHDNWHVAGLCGTGSKRVVVDDVFVPEDWSQALAKGSTGETSGGTRDGGVFSGSRGRLPANSVATLGLCGVTLGIARGALAEFQQRLGTKVRAGTFRGVEAQVGPPHRLAESAAEVDCAELLALRDCEEMERDAAANRKSSAKQRGRYRRDAAYVFHLCARAVTRLMPASGAHSIYRDAAPQRALRDTQAMAAHIVADWDMARESYSRSLLGLPIDDPAC
jgi:alkylation response protein AidB-like acyl-CoA dehydrogenase